MAVVVMNPKPPAELYDKSTLALEAAHREENDVREEILQARARSDTHLHLRNFDELTDMPPEIGTVVQAYRVTVENCFALRRFPETIGDLSERLEQLTISYCQLEELPREVCDLRFLQRLDCSNNRLRSLPSELDQLRCLEELSLDNNFLTAFPPAISYMKKMRHLSVYNNPLVDEDDVPHQPYKPASLVECDLCKAPVPNSDGETLIEMNFVDLAGNKSVPVAYFLCSKKCCAIVNELKDSEQTNYRILQYGDASY